MRFRRMTDTDYTLLAEDGEQIPSFLRALPRWLTWRLQESEAGKPTKVPDQSTLQLDRCRTFAQVCQQIPRKDWWSEQGGGFVMTGGLEVLTPNKLPVHVLLVDLDGCRDPASGRLTAWAMEAITLLGHSYTEVSPSGWGLRVIACVVEKPLALKAKMPLHFEQAPPGCPKKPEIQFFGLGPAGYATITGLRLKASLPGSPPLPNLVPFLDRFSMHGEPPQETEIAELTGSGEVPNAEEIAATIRQHERGQELLDGHWKKVFPKKSASEAFHLLEQWVLEAARGHGEAALKFLLSHTAWGRGEIEDSADAQRYTRRTWVGADLVRVAAKRPVAAPQDVFEALPPLPEENGRVEPAPLLGLGDPLEVIDQWEDEGPLVRLPTGIATLDEMTGGGFVLGSRVYMVGAPNAGKTALAVQIADVYLARGVVVGFLGVDEEPVDLATRLMQRRGLSRKDCEERAPATLTAAREALAKLRLRLFDGTVSIEKAAASLHAFAKQCYPGVDKPPCVLVVDSVQTARAEKEDLDASLYKAVTGRVAQLRRAAARYRMLVLVTSEMNRGAYKSKKVEDQTADMASAKESGAIEFTARVLLSLRSVPAQADLVELRVVKNKHGRDHRGDEDGIFLRIDRDRQEFAEDDEFKPLDVEEVQAVEKNDQRVLDAARIACVLFARECGVNALVEAGLTHGIGERRTENVRGWLTEVGAIKEVPGANRRKVLHLVPSKLPEGVREAFNRFMVGE